MALVVGVVGALGSAFVVGIAAGEWIAVTDDVRFIRGEDSGISFDRSSGGGENIVRFDWDGGARVVFSDSDENRDGTADIRMIDVWFDGVHSFHILTSDDDFDNEFAAPSFTIYESGKVSTQYLRGDPSDEHASGIQTIQLNTSNPNVRSWYIDRNLDGIFDVYRLMSSEPSDIVSYVLVGNTWRKQGYQPGSDEVVLEGSGEIVRFVDGEWVIELAEPD